MEKTGVEARGKFRLMGRRRRAGDPAGRFPGRGAGIVVVRDGRLVGPAHPAVGLDRRRRSGLVHGGGRSAGGAVVETGKGRAHVGGEPQEQRGAAQQGGRGQEQGEEHAEDTHRKGGKAPTAHLEEKEDGKAAQQVNRQDDGGHQQGPAQKRQRQKKMSNW